EPASNPRRVNMRAYSNDDQSSARLAFFTLPWRGRVDCRAQRRQAGWGELLCKSTKLTPPRLTSRYARCFADPPPPGEGEDVRVGRSNYRARSHLVLRLQRQADRLAGRDRALDRDGG